MKRCTNYQEYENEYTGAEQKLELRGFDNKLMNISGDKATEIGTYKAVAKRMGRDPDTVAKYVGRREAIQQVGLYYESVIEDIVK